MGNGCKARQRGSLPGGNIAEFRHFSNEHCAGNRSDSRDRAQYASCCGKFFIFGDDVLDPGFQLCNLAIQQAFEPAGL